VAKRAEPTFGWSNLDEDTHFRWKSTRGWDVLRLDGEQCENVKQGRILYPGLQTKEGLEQIARDGGGTDSAGYLTMGRGMYPRQGTALTIIPEGMFEKMRGEFIWLDNPQTVGATDLALDGGDPAVHSLGKWGLATGMKLPATREHPNGQIIMFKDDRGRVRPRYGLLLTKQFSLEPGETVKMSEQVIEVNRKSATKPEMYACDATGHGRGTADLVKHNWSSAIHSVNYSEGSTDDKIFVEDEKKCSEEYERMFTQLWFGLRKWAEFGYVLIAPGVDTSKLKQQVVSRRFRLGAGKSKAESKKDYQLRTNQGSPNEADSFTLLVHAARKGSGVTLSMSGESNLSRDTDMDDWPQSEYANGVRIDSTNQTDILDERDTVGDSIL